MKESNGSNWTPLPSTACYSYDSSLYNAYGDRYGAMESAARRKNATRETTNTLKSWLYEHRKNPYPTKGEKIMLAIITKMTLTQVSVIPFSHHFNLNLMSYFITSIEICGKRI